MKLKEKMSQMRQGWGGKGKDLIAGFISLFGRDGKNCQSILYHFCTWVDCRLYFFQSEFFHGQREMLRRVFTPPNAEDRALEEEEEGASSQANNSTPPYSPLPEFEDIESC